MTHCAICGLDKGGEFVCSSCYRIPLAEKDKIITAQKAEIERLRERVKELEEGISKVLMLPNFSIYYGEQFTKWLKAL